MFLFVNAESYSFWETDSKYLVDYCVFTLNYGGYFNTSDINLMSGLVSTDLYQTRHLRLRDSYNLLNRLHNEVLVSLVQTCSHNLYICLQIYYID